MSNNCLKICEEKWHENVGRRQFFFVVMSSYDESSKLEKVCLQEAEAIRFGRRLATKSDPNVTVSLYKQEISRAGLPIWVKNLPPFEDDNRELSSSDFRPNRSFD